MDEHIRFSEDHVWLLEMGDFARLGLSEYAQEQLGEIVSFAGAEVGHLLERGDPLGEVESQKTVIELPTPVTGTVRAINEEVVEDPSLVNVDPYGKGWLIEIELHEHEELDSLMNAEGYEAFIEE